MTVNTHPQLNPFWKITWRQVVENQTGCLKQEQQGQCLRSFALGSDTRSRRRNEKKKNMLYNRIILITKLLILISYSQRFIQPTWNLTSALHRLSLAWIGTWWHVQHKEGDDNFFSHLPRKYYIEKKQEKKDRSQHRFSHQCCLGKLAGSHQPAQRFLPSPQTHCSNGARVVQTKQWCIKIWYGAPMPEVRPCKPL